MNRPLLREVIPSLAEELTALLEQQGEQDLATQISELRLVDRCRCRDDFCATVYAARPPHGGWGSGHENVELNPKTGYLILDVVNRKITSIEVLYRDDIRQQVLALFP